MFPIALRCIDGILHCARIILRPCTDAPYASQFPPDYRSSIFVAEHGSWNRSKKSGYRIVRLALEGSKVVKQEVFAEGWLQGEPAWGRPVDVETMADGSLLVSDDQAGAIYRITYRSP